MNPKVPPRKALAKHPRIARALSLYNLCKSLGTLPEAGGLLDQPADFVTFAAIFAAADNEYQMSQEG